MIIFDLDGTLADCEHRRCYVDSKKSVNHILQGYDSNGKRFKPNWKAFYEACDQDTPIAPMIKLLHLLVTEYKFQIWSGRCESVRSKTENWLDDHFNLWRYADLEKPDYKHFLKMRPIGDSTPDDQLKEKWLDETIAQGQSIEFVFDNNDRSIEMWRRRNIFVFDVNQSEKDF